MKVREAVNRVRETLRGGGDAETTAWACAAQMDAETLRQLAASWLLESARNAERSAVRQVERDNTSVPEVKRKRPQISPELRAKYDEEDAAIRARFVESMNRNLAIYTAAIKVEWTRELLAQSFTVDGERVTWGAATVEQHRRRRDDFVTSATAASEAAARHDKAIEELSRTGATSLAEMVGVAAA